MNHETRRRDWLRRAGRARSVGDTPTADWCDEQADFHLNALRVKEAIARIEAGRA